MDKKDQLPLKWCLPQTHLLGADLFCPNSVRINFTIYLKSSPKLLSKYASTTIFINYPSVKTKQLNA
ncbi:hypothetical protein FIV28_15070 [Lactiplantibacillus plantarum]|nr:hypothetical protein [Lactiplantibacillus plantarum]